MGSARLKVTVRPAATDSFAHRRSGLGADRGGQPTKWEIPGWCR